jgi:spore germination cell wall hydrolase CwlJ-like protein
MNRLIRTAAAAACLFAFIGVIEPETSLAWEMEGAPSLSYIDHAAAGLEGDVALNPATDAAPAPAPAEEPVDAALEGHAAAAVLSGEDDGEKPRLSLAELVATHAATEVEDSEHECLAGAVYFESKGEPLQGQLTVAEVILNRADSGRFPRTLCGVVKQKGQFSFVRGGRIPPIAKSSPAWRKAVAIARIAIEDLADGAAPKAMFFHATYVSPGWNRTRLATVGRHIFYR